MAVPKYQDYLAAQLLSEGKIVSYRALSRALKVHSNVAKEMLYEFHRTQNARKPGAIHATYLLTGRRKKIDAKKSNGFHSQGGDSEMADSSFMSSSMPDQDYSKDVVPVTSITLVNQEDLDDVRQLYEDTTSIHIYSLEPGPLDNIQILSDCNRKIAADYPTEDPLETWKRYGTICNPLTKRRTPIRPLPPTSIVPAAPAPVTTTVKAIPKASAKVTAPNPEPSLRRTSTSESKQEDHSAKKQPAKTPALKRDNSNIFKSFAKAKSTPKQEIPGSDASAAPSPAASGGGGDSQVEDEVMKDAPASDDEYEFDEDVTLPTNSAEAAEKAEAFRKAKKDREEALRNMMEDDEDEVMADSPATDADNTTHPLPLEPTADAQSLQPQSPAEADGLPQAEVSNGRRRGRRKVMKKKTTRDAEGYLVTKEEAAWESFSEDEPATQPQEPAAKKVKGPVVASSATPTPDFRASKDKAKKGKPGQGNIMNFFAKK